MKACTLHPFPGPLYDVWAGSQRLPACLAAPIHQVLLRAELAEGVGGSGGFGAVTLLFSRRGSQGGHTGGWAVVY